MITAKTLLASLSGLLVLVPLASAQSTPEPLPARPIAFDAAQIVPPDDNVLAISRAQVQELDAWVRDFDEWQQDADRWIQGRLRGSWTEFAAEHVKPEPPEWLADACELLYDDVEFSNPCRLLAVWPDAPFGVKANQTLAAAALKKEDTTKTLWWQHMHVDGLWSTTQSNVTAFGIFGAHMTVEVTGRFQVFVVPGILLVSVPGFSGHRELSPATDWGVTYRLFHIGRSTVHFNLVRAWMIGNRANLVLPNMTLAGFSVSFRPRPR